MASILDLLKAKGIDPSQLSSSVSPDQQDTLAQLQAAAQAQPAQSAPQPQSSPQGDPGKGPSESAQKGLLAILSNVKSKQLAQSSPDGSSAATPSPQPGPANPKLPQDAPATGPAKTDAVPQTPTNQDGVFAGFPSKYDSQNQPDSSDSEDDGSSPGSSKSSSSLQLSGKTGDSQKQAMQGILNQGGFTNNTVEGLKAAQDQSRKDQALDGVMKAVNQISSGIYGMGHNAKAADLSDSNKFYDQQDALAKQGVTDFTARGEQEKNDPNSAISAQARSFAGPLLAKLGMKMPDNVSYAALEKLNPQLTKMSDAQELRQARSDDLRYKYDALSAIKDNANSKQASNQDVKRLDTANKLITSGLASSRSGFGKDAGNLMAVQNAKALLSGANLDDIDTRQIAETARVLDRILSSGNPTISGTEHLTPETARMKIAKQLEFVTNKRQGAGASSFLDNTLHTLDREENVAKQRTANTMQQALGSYKDIAQRNPEAWDSMISSHPEIAEVMNSGALSGKSKASSPVSPQAPSGKITVSKGNEKYEIDPSDLEHAKADGFEEVK